MNPREVLGLRLWLVSHEMSTSGSPTEQFEICVIADLQKMAVAEWLQSFNSVRGPMERLGIM